MMGKKKPQKTKELSVAIAEASSTIDDEKEQQEVQPQAPRKRGRPRKVIAKMEESEEEKTQVIEQHRRGSLSAQGTESSMEKEKVTTNEEEGTSSAAACMRVAEQEEMQLPKVEPSRSRARRKSKPRKMSIETLEELLVYLLLFLFSYWKRMIELRRKKKEWKREKHNIECECHVPMKNA